MEWRCILWCTFFLYTEYHQLRWQKYLNCCASNSFISYFICIQHCREIYVRLWAIQVELNNFQTSDHLNLYLFFQFKCLTYKVSEITFALLAVFPQALDHLLIAFVQDHYVKIKLMNIQQKNPTGPISRVSSTETPIWN